MLNVMENLVIKMASTFSLADVTAQELCQKMTPVFTIAGYVIFAIKIVVPLLLIITGMLTLAKAVAAGKEDEIKKAQGFLIKKIIVAILVYLVITITGIVVGLVTNENWQDCAKCAFHPFGNECTITSSLDDPNLPSTGGSTGGTPTTGE